MALHLLVFEAGGSSSGAGLVIPPVYGAMTQWQRVCFASRKLGVRVPLAPPILEGVRSDQRKG